jgi:hypothetical protein
VQAFITDPLDGRNAEGLALATGPNMQAESLVFSAARASGLVRLREMSIVATFVPT